MGQPQLSWVRCLNLHAYTATRYYMMEARGPLRYKLVAGNTAPLEDGWRVQFSFYAFDQQIPGTTRFFVQKQTEPFERIRITMDEHAGMFSVEKGWVASGSFC